MIAIKSWPEPATKPCGHGFFYVAERKMWGTLYLPPTRQCVKCAHEVAFQEVAEEASFDAFMDRLQARQQ